MNKLTITNTDWNRQLEIYPGQEHYAIVRISRPGQDSLAIAIKPEEAKQVIEKLTNFIPSAAFTERTKPEQTLKEVNHVLNIAAIPIDTLGDTVNRVDKLAKTKKLYSDFRSRLKQHCQMRSDLDLGDVYTVDRILDMIADLDKQITDIK